ncbi:MAG: putative adenylyl cyclase CyaB [Parasphingorhabdus sp.]|jgi:predicted adenylyl cyclase CyaB
MPRNVEIKARIEDVEALEGKVIAIADSEPTEIIQDDTFFECANGRLKLRTFCEERGELIFYKRSDESGPKQSFYLISKTSEPSTLREALRQAYGTAGRVQKRRLLYFFGRTRIHLDRVMGLGNFLELEVVLEDNESSEDGIKEAKTILFQLGVEDAQLVEGAYVDLLG